MLTIRLATRDDVPQLLGLIRQLAAYEGKADQVVTAEADLLRDGFGPQAKFRALLAEWDGQAAGYASTFYFYSTYQGRPAIFIEDLFVLDSFRDRGSASRCCVPLPNWPSTKAVSACAGRFWTGIARPSSGTRSWGQRSSASAKP